MECTVRMIADWMAEWADPSWAESYDNVGLLIGHEDAAVDTVVTALDVTEGAIAYAVREGAQMIVSHHPLLFRGAKTIVDGDRDGARLLMLIENHLAVCAAHTNMDAALGGTNDIAAEKLGLTDVVPIEPVPGDDSGAGMGRIGRLPAAMTVRQFAELVKEVFDIPSVRMISSDPDAVIQKTALCTGKGMGFYKVARMAGAEIYLTGDVTYHEAEEALATGAHIIDAGHFGTEFPIAEAIAQYLQQQDETLTVLPYREARDPFTVV